MEAAFGATALLHPFKTQNPLLLPQAKLPDKAKYPSLKRVRSCSISSISTDKEPVLAEDWSRLLKLSIGSGNFLLGQAIHAFLIKSNSTNDAFQGNNLLNFYAKFNELGDARKLFDEIPVRNTITWTTLIKGYLDNEDYKSVFGITHDMCFYGEKFNEHTCSVILEACREEEDLIRGGQIHGFVIKSGIQQNVFVGTSLISMYSTSGFLNEAEKVFDNIGFKDVQCLNYMIFQYGKAGCMEKAFRVLVDMLSSGLEPTDYTFTNIISTCSENVGIDEGRQLHGLAVKFGVVNVTSLGNALITMYGKLGMVEYSERMFYSMSEKNLISWTALISGYVRSGCGENAVHMFLELLDQGIYCDSGCLVTVLDGCSECRNLDLGVQLHAFVIKVGHLCDGNIVTALVDMYSKSDNLTSAKIVFDGFSNKNIALFNAILVGFMVTKRDDNEDAMVLFHQLRLGGIKPDLVTFSRLLSLSANQACLVKGKTLHAYTIKTGFEAELTVSNALITMYAKCGSIKDACQMFNGMNGHDSVSWNAMVSAYSIHGQGKMALLLFKEMKSEGIAPDEITTLAILQACSYNGLWQDGICLFNEMESNYGIRPVIEHFACMVDLLGRAGRLPEAMNFINNSPFPDSPLLWRTLVSVCKLQGDLGFGMLASKKLLDLSPAEAGSYILVSNTYAGSGMLDEAAKVRTAMNDLNLSKVAGCSWIEIDNKVHCFVASDNDHPESREIYAKLDLLMDEIRWKNCDTKNAHFIGEIV
ncbi:pentatricopeptide repeat-containing protein At2g33680-like [Durio zibethinus]|uniref:Pentatricopeptide repeat-containing protein At2g33680-like n=1 Tax=Durio zibethinus TaxID=66656 RepID=A0A6P5YPY8_DURZI|nr:pentatricopeptide repeat-containing protein At2g33680-like [Durio zibethinus]